MRRLFALLFLAAPAQAQTYFVPVPFTLTGGTAADATQVMADFNSEIANGNTAVTALLAQMAAKGVGLPIPSGFTSYFNLASCPTGWTDDGGGVGGYFVKGAAAGGSDFGANNSSHFQDHVHSYNQQYITSTGNLVMENNGGNNHTSYYSANYYGGTTTGGMAGGGGTETRPKNIALLICKKN